MLTLERLSHQTDSALVQGDRRLRWHALCSTAFAGQRLGDRRLRWHAFAAPPSSEGGTDLNCPPPKKKRRSGGAITLWLDRGIHMWRRPRTDQARRCLAARSTMEQTILIDLRPTHAQTRNSQAPTLIQGRPLSKAKLRRLLREIADLKTQKLHGGLLNPSQEAKLLR